MRPEDEFDCGLRPHQVARTIGRSRLCRWVSLARVRGSALRLGPAFRRRVLRCNEETSFGQMRQLDKIGGNLDKIDRTLAIFDRNSPPDGVSGERIAQAHVSSEAGLNAREAPPAALFDDHLP